MVAMEASSPGLDHSQFFNVAQPGNVDEATKISQRRCNGLHACLHGHMSMQVVAIDMRHFHQLLAPVMSWSLTCIANEDNHIFNDACVITMCHPVYTVYMYHTSK